MNKQNELLTHPIDFTHAPDARSWVESANSAETDFPLQNLPYGCFFTKQDPAPRLGVAIGDQVLDLRRAVAAGIQLPIELAGESLNAFMALHRQEHKRARQVLFKELQEGSSDQVALKPCLLPQSDVQMVLPCDVRNYTDFLTGIYHAQTCGQLVGKPLGDNFKSLPIAYHGRASSVVISGTPVRRPMGQHLDTDGTAVFRPTRQLDYELELGVLIGAGNKLSQPIPVNEAADHWFGLVLLNDWSARDVQRWEAQPLGPFLAKNFATSISSWVVTQDALAPFRSGLRAGGANKAEQLPYLRAADDASYAIQMEVWLQGRSMPAPCCVTANRFDTTSYWTIAQMIAHHTVGGCNLLTGDLLGTGTQSGPGPEEGGCMLELTQAGRKSVSLDNAETRTYLEDGDSVTLRAFCQADGFRRIGFGHCVGQVLPAQVPVY